MEKTRTPPVSSLSPWAFPHIYIYIYMIYDGETFSFLKLRSLFNRKNSTATQEAMGLRMSLTAAGARRWLESHLAVASHALCQGHPKPIPTLTSAIHLRSLACCSGVVVVVPSSVNLSGTNMNCFFNASKHTAPLQVLCFCLGLVLERRKGRRRIHV